MRDAIEVLNDLPPAVALAVLAGVLCIGVAVLFRLLSKKAGSKASTEAGGKA